MPTGIQSFTDYVMTGGGGVPPPPLAPALSYTFLPPEAVELEVSLVLSHMFGYLKTENIDEMNNFHS